MSDISVSAVTSLPKTYQYTDIINKVVSMPDGKDKVIQTNYVVTVYDVNGRLSTTHSNHQIDYLI